MHRWESLIEETRQQHSFFDMFTQRWISEYAASGGVTFCRKGCSGCCTLPVYATFTEAVAVALSLTPEVVTRVAEFVDRLSKRLHCIGNMKDLFTMYRREMGTCPFLDTEGSCIIYSRRPLPCRGLISTTDSYWCSVDFAAVAKSEKQKFIERLDVRVVDFPSHYVAALKEMGSDMEKAALRKMADIFGRSVYGHFPVSVFLVNEHRSRKGATELDAILETAEEYGLNHPLLLNISP
ncbi:YkgJ family cysteine cluster protein [Geobacter sp. DSM 9736]|uniref:YkgJ family cysteine cluster protein n=1 Tax=Geobacter sp. DSM 9736 TaxID=1277350 RepID=UPI000B61C7CC|nr:YkgJ family cysteine cluster protein [Geobacter sp. DSM 9736]SNB45669.1 Putative zinc- or iron-chelating domain-containing protein [Geobacter sp. DSM 9736]